MLTLSGLPGFVLHQQRKGLFHRSVSVVLHCDDISLVKLAERFGTPLYVYSATAIRERFAVFDDAFRKFPHTVCYSVKANSNLSILRLLARQGPASTWSRAENWSASWPRTVTPPGRLYFPA